MSRLPLVDSGLDRVAHRRTDQGWLAEAWRSARVLAVCGGRALARTVDGQPGKAALVLLDPGAVAADAERYLLGVDPAGVGYFAVAMELPEVDDARPVTLREVGEDLPDWEAALFATAVALAGWHERHGFCPVDGSPTVPGEAGWIRATVSGTHTMWPRTDPAVIVLIHDDVAGDAGRCLLASNVSWPETAGVRRYSCVAGFVEPGESAEQAVLREVGEEVGLAVAGVRYVRSQPWPFPGSLMLGFTATADRAEALRLGADEIAHARWFTRPEIRAALAGDPGVGFALPTSLSIANYLIAEWAADRTAGPVSPSRSGPGPA